MTGIRDYNPLTARIHDQWMPLLLTLGSLLTGWLAPHHQYTASDPSWPRMIGAFSGQWAHMDAPHLLLNLVGLYLLCWGMHPWRTPRRDAWLLMGGLLGVWAGLLLHPQIGWYRGLSGALHGLFCGYALLILIADPNIRVRAVAALLLIGAAVKLALEDPVFGLTTPPLEATRPVLHAAHRWGALGGLAASIILWTLQRRPSEKDSADRATPQSPTPEKKGQSPEEP